MRYASRIFYTCLSKETGIPQSSVYRILHHELHLFPYKFQLSQAITKNHKELRVSFAQFLLENIDLLRQILLSDEAYFSLEGHVHRNNCIIWAFEKPEQTAQRSLRAPQICTCLVCVHSWLCSQAVFLWPHGYWYSLPKHAWASCYSAASWKREPRFRDFSAWRCTPSLFYDSQRLPEGSFNRRADYWERLQTTMASTAPDLTPLYFFFALGVLKSWVYFHFKPQTLEQLKSRIEHVCCEVSHQSEL